MVSILSIGLASTFLAVVAVGLVLRLSHSKSWYDHINDRKIHNGDIPRLGGVGFGPVFIIFAVIISFFFKEADFSRRFLPCLFAIVISLVFGVLDDFRPMSPFVKFLGQMIAALCVLIPGFMFKRLLYVETGFFSYLGWLGFPLTCLWLVGLANAMNFIDGVDGLAGGISGIIALTLGVIFFFSKTEINSSILFCAALVGAVLGFLVFNAPLPHAKIFMGDGGSQFLGFTLAILPLLEGYETRAALPLMYAVPLFAIPILDTTAAVWRRLRDGKRIDAPDRAHIHHKLINLGLNARGVDAVLYLLQIALGALVFIAVCHRGNLCFVFLGLAYLLPVAFFVTIHFLNRKAMLLNVAENSISGDGPGECHRNMDIIAPSPQSTV